MNASDESQVELTEEQLGAAARLSTKHLKFANFMLEKDVHGLPEGECYRQCGYKPKTDASAAAAASKLLKTDKVQNYLEVMRKESLVKAGLTLEYLDQELLAIIRGDIGRVVNTWTKIGSKDVVDEATGVVIKQGTPDQNIPILRCSMDDLDENTRRSIKEIKMTTAGISVKTYCRMDAMKLAYQRLGGLIERRELSGPGGGPMQTKNMDPLTDEELEAIVSGKD